VDIIEISHHANFLGEELVVMVVAVIVEAARTDKKIRTPITLVIVSFTLLQAVFAGGNMLFLDGE